MIQAKLADMYTTLSASRSYVYNVARSLDEGHINPNVSAHACVLPNDLFSVN